MEQGKAVSAAASAAATLRSRILAGTLKSGTPLREIVLIEDLKISRNTLREAFVQLTLDGLTEQQLYKGTVVRSIEEDEVRDIFIARRTFELRAIDQSSFAPRSSLDRMTDAVERSQILVSKNAWAEAGTAGMEFHQAIVSFLGSSRMDAMFEVLCAQMRLAFAAFADEASYQSPWLKRDIDICDALKRGKRQDAYHLMEEYLDQSERLLLDTMRDRGRSKTGRALTAGQV